MKIIQKPGQPLMHWILSLFLSLIFFHAAFAQDKVTKQQDTEKRESVAPTAQNHAETIQSLQESIKELKAENEALRQENERDRMISAQKLNAIEARLAKIEKDASGHNNTGSGPVLVLRSPRYDSNYTPIYSEPIGRVRRQKNERVTTQQ